MDSALQNSEKYFSIQNRRYLGNKYKLIDFIKETIRKHCPNTTSVFDLFGGTGVVASSLMDEYDVSINDILYSNYLSYVAFIGTEQFDENKILSYLKCFNSLDDSRIEDNYMSENFGDTFFSYNICKRIGYIREFIQTLYNDKKINFREFAILITSLIYAMDRIANTCGHYDAYLKEKGINEKLILLPLKTLKTKKNIRLYNDDANVLIKDKSIQSIDCVYLDPPYNSRNYCDAYHLLENVAKWEKPPVYGKAKKMDRKTLKSKYCSSKAKETFEDLVLSLNCKYIVLSYNNTGKKLNARSNACLTDNEIIEVLSKRGSVKIYSKQHKAFSTGKNKNIKNKERLFVCTIDNEKKSKIIKSPLNYIGGKTKLLPQLLPLFPKKINAFVDLFCGGANVGINVNANKNIYCDKNVDLIEMLKVIKDTPIDDLLEEITKIIKDYGLSDSSIYGYTRYNSLSSIGLATYNKKAFMLLRNDFNKNYAKTDDYYIMLYVLVIFSFNNQIRFNKMHKFNLPVGKRDFNHNMQKNLNEFKHTLDTQNAFFLCADFRNFDITQLSYKDFVYCDPPYLITTGSYNEQNGWTEQDERDLLAFLDKLNRMGIKFALSNVLKHKGKENVLLLNWSSKYTVHKLDFNYKNSNYQSKNKDALTEEVLITNY